MIDAIELKWAQLIREMTAKGDQTLEFLTDRYKPEIVSEALGSVASALGLYLATVLQEQKDPQHIAGRQLAIYLDTLWKRLLAWETSPCDLLAWTARNLMEVHFWTKLVVGSPDNAAGFLREAEIDQRELWDQHLNTKEPEDFQDLGLCVIKVLAERIAGKRMRVEFEDQLLFKKCSKYIHPSAWLIADCERLMNDRYPRYQFLAFSLYYLSKTTSLLLKSHPETAFLSGEVEPA